MKNRPKPIRAWVCTWHMTSCESYWLLETLAKTRNEAITKFRAGRGARANVPWSEFYDEGARCLRVSIQTIS